WCPGKTTRDGRRVACSRDLAPDRHRRRSGDRTHTHAPRRSMGMGIAEHQVVVGLDVGGTTCNATVLDAGGTFLVDQMVETASRVTAGPQVAIEVLAGALDDILARTGFTRSAVAAVGLDTPGPASAAGVLSSRGATNFSDPAWHGFDF